MLLGHRWTRAAFAAALATLALATPASATLDVNVVVDGGAENVDASPFFDDQAISSAWSVTGRFSAREYGGDGFPDLADAFAVNGGSNFFEGGAADDSAAFQEVSLAADAGAIASGEIDAELSADLGGKDAETDAAIVTATFFDADGGQVGAPLVIGPVTANDRFEDTRLTNRTATADLSPAARTAQVVITSSRDEGDNADGYADNVSLVLLDRRPAPPPPADPVPVDPTPTPAPFVIGQGAPINVLPPTISGSTSPGGTATCDPGQWFYNPTDFTYQWRLAGADVAGATSPAFTIPDDANGKALVCVVTATIAGASDTTASPAVTVGGGSGGAGKPSCVEVAERCPKKGKVCDAGHADEYAVFGLACKRRKGARRLVRASDKVLRGGSPVVIGKDGIPSMQRAMWVFDKVLSPLPGVQAPKGAIAGTVDGTAALRWMFAYEDKLPKAQRRAFERWLDKPTASAAQEDPRVGTFRGLVAEAQARLRSHGIVFNHPVRVIEAPQDSRGALLATLPLWIVKRGNLCQIEVYPRGLARIASAHESIAHELFHCAQGELYSSRAAWVGSPAWVTEGGAEWAGARIAQEWGKDMGVAEEWYAKYLVSTSNDLFQRSYDAFPFYQHLEHEGANVWGLLLRIERASQSSSAAAYAVAKGAVPTLVNSWGPLDATSPTFTPAFDLAMPGLPRSAPALAPGLDVTNGSSEPLIFAARGGWGVPIDLRADVVTIETGGNGELGKLRSSGGVDYPIGDDSYCAKAGGCECPDGGRLEELPPIERGEGRIGVAGEKFSRVTVKGESLEDWCGQTATDGISIYTGSGDSLSLDGVIKAGSCKVSSKTGFTANATSADKRWKLIVRIESFSGFGGDYNLFYGGKDPSFALTGPGGPYSNAFAVQGFPGGGGIAFDSKGERMGFGMAPAFNEGYQSVQILGGMKCRYPKKKPAKKS